jgi:hypothetical protein
LDRHCTAANLAFGADLAKVRGISSVSLQQQWPEAAHIAQQSNLQRNDTILDYKFRQNVISAGVALDDLLDR